MVNNREVVDFYADNRKMKAFQLLKRKWAILKEISYVLSIPYKATIELQKQNLTLSDVFGIWLKAQLHLNACVNLKKNYKTDLAKHLLSAMNERKETVFKNPLMAAALFLDPRFRRQITQNEEKMDEAIKTLKNIWRRLVTLNAVNQNVSVEEVNMNISDKSAGSNISFEFDERAEMNKFLSGNQNAVSVAKSHEIDIEHCLEMFDPPAMSSESDIFEFWKSVKDQNAEMYELAMAVFAVPPTEVQIERDFSKLNFVFTDRRCSLTEERLEDIMIIHLNDELFYQVKNDLLNNFKQ